MWDVSSQWLQLADGPHRALCGVSTWYAGQVTAAPDVTGGTYKSELDGVTVRRSVEVTVDAGDGQLFPVAADDPLAPYGQQLTVDQTLQVGGWSETVPLGRYVLDSPQPAGRWTEHHGRALRVGDLVQVQGTDLLQLLVETPIRGLLQPRPAATVASEIERLCSGLAPVDTSNIPDTTIVGKGITYQSDRLATVVQLATIAGRGVAMSRAGVVEFPTLQLAAAPVLDVTVAAGRWIDSTVAHTRDGIYNACEVVGADPGNGRPVRGYAQVTGGPYGADGPLGVRLLQVESDLVRSTAKATDMAQQQLAQAVTGRQVRFTVQELWNPAVDVGDTHLVTVVPDRTDTGRDRLQVLAMVVGVEWSLTGGPMTVTYSAPRDRVTPWT